MHWMQKTRRISCWVRTGGALVDGEPARSDAGAADDTAPAAGEGDELSRINCDLVAGAAGEAQGVYAEEEAVDDGTHRVDCGKFI